MRTPMQVQYVTDVHTYTLGSCRVALKTTTTSFILKKRNENNEENREEAKRNFQVEKHLQFVSVNSSNVLIKVDRENCR